MRLTIPFVFAALAGLSACAETGMSNAKAPAATVEITADDMRWAGQPGAEDWTEASLAALETHGAALLSTVPRDIGTWCPGYADATEEARKAFWTGMMSALSKHESTWNERAVGGGGRWFGLVQIAPATARGYGCDARSGEALKDGELNLSCAIRIAAVTVPRDGVVSAGMGGLAADWGPFHSARKREDMRDWISSQPYCAPTES